MNQVRFSQGLQPSRVLVAGCEVKLFFSMRAAAAMEAHFGRSYLDVVLEMLQTPDDDGKPRPPLAVEDQAAIVAILMRCAGQEISAAELTALHMTDFSALALAAQSEILLKMPQDKKKRLLASMLRGTGHRSSETADGPSA